MSRDTDNHDNDYDMGIQATNHHPQNQHMTNEDLLKPIKSTVPTNVHLPPKSLWKCFTHSDYLNAAKFVSILSAVAHNNNHYPTITIQRRLLQKSWEVNTIVTCQTQVLNGLSYHDFYIAMMIDVEVQREEVVRLLVDSKDS
jgi:pterin-4a-carbinolamine dehydratase